MEQIDDVTVSVIIDRFIDDYKIRFTEQVVDVGRRLKSMGSVTGCTPNFFKEDEGLAPDDLVCALYDVPDKYLRLYCIRLNDSIVIVGSGGPKTTRTWQEDTVLKREVDKMMVISKIVRTKLQNGELRISAAGLRLEGDLFISRT
ncbi:MAG: hypothetical protein J0I09_08110 [Sphingobacteriia bacterium]|nr:hypothetical protein [Sphingobacteriia bacterium]